MKPEAPAVASPEPPESPEAARSLLGDRLPLMQRFVAHLADTGTSHGLIGPREIPRLWDRHVLNCAVIADGIPSGVAIADIGSGAGLPGLVLAIARPDLRVTLVEPLLRRVTWLETVRADLGLEQVTVCRARAEQLHGELTVDVVTSRAVARLDTLAGWCLPLLPAGGHMLAMKGSSAADEVAEASDTIAALGGATPQVRECGVGVVEPPTVVVDILRERRVDPRPAARRARRSRKARR
ncbi:16S rRNA (guanine(527)-N(7))-methyltransferase RsmG [Metallococcus carri]|uniref:16S rRNA (guanine(527)-N(7))-methyltransferase RsmG n=1 Tax=Metallococcus carri TaxID=1656884 RepID=UPI002E2D1D3C|nr:16S rRNA (guanine(527)-N(7))-methyltransferase RsmG [Metallococcus carri]